MNKYGPKTIAVLAALRASGQPMTIQEICTATRLRRYDISRVIQNGRARTPCLFNSHDGVMTGTRHAYRYTLNEDVASRAEGYQKTRLDDDIAKAREISSRAPKTGLRTIWAGGHYGATL